MSTTALGLAFSAGMLASINPCAFAMLPSMVSFYLGVGQEDFRARSLWRRSAEGVRLGALTTAGFLVVFLLAGMVVSLGAGWLAAVFPWATVVVGAGLVLLGGWLYLGRGLSLHLPYLAAPRLTGSARAMFGYGIAYALASLGCTLPIFLIAVGTAVGSRPGSELAQFVVYSLGMGVVITAVALGAALFRGIVSSTLRQVVPYVQQISALLLVVAGGSVLWSDLPRLVY